MTATALVIGGTESHHPQAGRIIEPKTPANFSVTPSGIGGPSASLGQHSDEILATMPSRSSYCATATSSASFSEVARPAGVADK